MTSTPPFIKREVNLCPLEIEWKWPFIVEKMHKFAGYCEVLWEKQHIRQSQADRLM